MCDVENDNNLQIKQSDKQRNRISFDALESYVTKQNIKKKHLKCLVKNAFLLAITFSRCSATVADNCIEFEGEICDYFTRLKTIPKVIGVSSSTNTMFIVQCAFCSAK